MNEAQLITHLVEELRPVQRLAPASRRAAAWMLGAMAYMFILSAVLGIRPDITEIIASPRFLVESCALVAVAAGAALWAFQRSIPGRNAVAFEIAIAIGAVVWLASVHSHGSPEHASGWTCVGRMAAFGAIPALVGVALLRRSNPLEPRRIYRLGVLAAGIVAMIGTQLVCPRDGAEHLLRWHLTPLIVAVWLAGRLWQRSDLAGVR